jgi:NADH-quinone oxidoreductase subunit J
VESWGIENVGTLEMAVFAVLALAAVVGALFTITRKNPVAAVMSLVGTFFALAGIYATLNAHFLAVLQVLVYAGAIMVLFIFVVMILNREEVEPISFRGIITRGVGVVASIFGVLIAVRLVLVTRDTTLMKGAGAALPEDYGTVGAAGLSLFKDFIYPFEAISLLLLVAVVGGVLVSRSHKQEEQAEAEAARMRAVHAAAGPEHRLGPAGAESAHAAQAGHH